MFDIVCHPIFGLHRDLKTKCNGGHMFKITVQGTLFEDRLQIPWKHQYLNLL